MLMDPLVGAICTPPEISQLTDEMLIAQAQWLPQYVNEIPAAQARFASEPRFGTQTSRGAARLEHASAEERAAEAKHLRHIMTGASSDPGE